MLAAALEDLAGLENRQGYKDQAVAHADEAYDLYAETGAALHARRLRRLRRSSVGVTRARDDSQPAVNALARLTRTQQEVALLAAKRHTKTEISEQLSMAYGTVDHHLRAVYSRLGVPNRAALARMIANDLESG
jgi:DNA-binding NarL/FixJ family response regulator